MRIRVLIVLASMVLMALAGCNLASDNNNNDNSQPLPTSTPTGRPTVRIVSPNDGTEVVVNEPVLINVEAVDSVGVTSVQLSANGQTVRTQAVESDTESTQVLLDYTPRSQGNVTLQVVAFRGRVASEPDEIGISVRTSQAQITATAPSGGGVPIIDPNDPTCRALVNTGLNFRRGPSTSFDVIRVLRAGEVLPITGRLADNSWWQMRSGTTLGWVSAPYVTIYGICTGVPVVAPPVTPTITPTSTNPVTATATPSPTPSITSTPVLPNLTITNISGPNSVTIPAGESSITQRYSVNITNTGGPVNQQFSNIAQLLPGTDEFDVGVVANLEGGQSISLSFEVTFTTTGSYILRVTADSDEEIEESNDVDNTGTITVTVSSG